MAQFQKLEKELELKCCADKIFQMILANQSKIPEVCSDNVSSNKALHGDGTCVGSIRKWDYVIDGKSQCLTERIEAIDKENKIIHRSVIDGDIMKNHYKAFASKLQLVPKENGYCMVKITLEYEKMNEDAPEPYQFMEFGFEVLNKLACYFAKGN